jgi:adenylate cyclase class IV
MPNEVELKALVVDPVTVRMRLLAVGAVVRFRGSMSDRRYDRGGELTARDEVLRLRTFERESGGSDAVLGWKGPTRRTASGYKEREEIELALGDAGSGPASFLAALGYEVVHAIDRWVEVFELGGTMLRLESYPRMDDLLEVEGEPEAIQRAIAATGIPRSAFSADSLTEFVLRYQARTGEPAVLSSSSGSARPPAWASA